MKHSLSLGFIMKMFAIVLIIAFLATSPFTCATKLVVPGTDFSHTVVPGHKSVLGHLTAKHTRFSSLTVYGDKNNSGIADLDQCQVSGCLDVTGQLNTKDCTVDSLSKLGAGELRNTTIVKKFSSTGSTTAHDCTFGTFSGTGAISFDNTQVEDTISNTGKVKLNKAKCQKLSITGSVEAKDLSCASASITGKTRLTNCSVPEKTSVTGNVTVAGSSLGSLKVTGKTHVSDSSVPQLSVTGKCTLTKTRTTNTECVGSLTATESDAQTCSIVCKDATFTNCAVDTVWVKKQASIKIGWFTFSGSDNNLKTTVIVYNSPKHPERTIKKIICEDPATKIIFKDDSLRTTIIEGTTNIV